MTTLTMGNEGKLYSANSEEITASEQQKCWFILKY